MNTLIQNKLMSQASNIASMAYRAYKVPTSKQSMGEWQYQKISEMKLRYLEEIKECKRQLVTIEIWHADTKRKHNYAYDKWNAVADQINDVHYIPPSWSDIHDKYEGLKKKSIALSDQLFEYERKMKMWKKLIEEKEKFLAGFK